MSLGTSALANPILIEHSGASQDGGQRQDRRQRIQAETGLCNRLTEQMIEEMVAAHLELSRKKCIEVLIDPPAASLIMRNYPVPSSSRGRPVLHLDPIRRE